MQKQIVKNITVLYHIFYEDTVANIESEMAALIEYKPLFLFNICVNVPNKNTIYSVLRKTFPESLIICSSNKGKDIGGKLLLLSLFQQLELSTEYFVFLHDKKSLQAVTSTCWKSGLMKIVDAAIIPDIISLFNRDERCGIVASKPYIQNEKVDGGFISTNNAILTKLTIQFNLRPTDFHYVAGTMFWARAKPFKNFFHLHHPISIRTTLEEGNVLDDFSGTHTHSWERLFSWIVTAQGLTIKGV